MSNILKVDGLTKWFGTIKAIENITFSVNKGEVVGVLGPNGSGKSTTLAILLGIKYPSKGSFTWFENQTETLYNKRIGALLEVPYFFPYLNLKRNLQIVAEIRGKGHNNINQVLDMVGLAKRSNSSYYTLSLGMKQRLAIASTLLGDPEVLVLDEPTNGLDPEGIADVRNIIKEQTHRGKTIIMASHILDEVEKVCSNVIILKSGNILSQGKVQDLLTEKILVTISSNSIIELYETIESYEMATVVRKEENELLISLKDGTNTSQLNQWLIERGITLSQITVHKSSLETQFLELIKKQ